MRYVVAIFVALWSGVAWGGKLYMYDAVPFPQQPTQIYAIWFDYPVALDPPGPSGYIWEPSYATFRVPELGWNIPLYWNNSTFSWDSEDKTFRTENMRYNISDYTLSEILPDGTRVLRLESDIPMLEVFNRYQQRIYTPLGAYRPAWDTHTGDVNRDRSTDALDAGTMFEHWGTSTPKTTAGHYVDLNGDGIVDAFDAGIVFEGWTGDVAPVPEPNGLWLLGIGAYYLRRTVAELHL